MKKSKRKNWIKLGLLGVVGAPIASVVSCSCNELVENVNDTNAPIIVVDKVEVVSGVEIESIGSSSIHLLSLEKNTEIQEEEIEELFKGIDDVDGDIELNFVWESPLDTTQSGTYVLSVTAQDIAGNETIDMLVVTVEDSDDKTAPVITVDQETQVGGATIASSADDELVYFLTINSNNDVKEEDIQALFKAEDNVDGEIEPDFTWFQPLDTDHPGTYVLTITAEDVAGNETTYTLVVNVEGGDAVAPVVTVDQTTPVGGATIASSTDDELVYFLTLEKGAGVAEADIEALFEAKDDMEGDVEPKFEWSPDLNAEEAGTYVLTVLAEDSAGNVTVYTLVVTVLEDQVAPVVTVDQTTPVGGATIASSTDDDLVYFLTLEKGAGVAEADIEALFGASDDTDGEIKPDFNWETPLNTTQSGTYVLTITAEDEAGNVAVCTLVIIVGADESGPTIDVDQTTPVGGATIASSADDDLVYFLTLEKGAGVAEADIEALFGASDDTDGEIKPDFNWGTPLNTTQSGTYVLTITAEDEAGNVAVCTLVIIVGADESGPTIDVDQTTPVGGVTIASSADDDLVYFLTLEKGAGVAEADIEALFEAKDDMEGDVEPKFEWSPDLNAEEAGTYVLTVLAEDSAGNVTVYTLVVTVLEDQVAPVVTVDQTTPVGGATIASSADDDLVYFLTLEKGAGVAEADIEALFGASDDTDGEIKPDFNWGTPLNTTQSGTYVLTITAEDEAGNVAVCTLVIIVGADESGPTIDVDQTTPVGGATIASSADDDLVYFLTLEKGAGVAEADIEALFEAKDDMEGDVEPKFEWSPDLNAEEAGTYVLTVLAEDSAGNVTVYTLVVTVLEDQVAPVVTVDQTTPVGGATIASSTDDELVYFLTLEKGAGVAKADIEALFEAKDDMEGDVEPKFEWSPDLNAEEAGTYVLTVLAEDSAGNVTVYTLVVTVLEDQVPPVIEVDTEKEVGGAATIQQNSGLVYSLNLENGADVDEADIEALFEASDDTDGEIEPGFTWVTPLDTDQPGDYVVTISATDNAGNVTVYTLVVTVFDATYPTIIVDMVTPIPADGETIQKDYNMVYSLNLENGADVDEADIEALFEASDDTDGEIEPDFTWVTPLDTDQPGDYVVTISATDNAGNTTVYILIVNVVDEVPPVINIDMAKEVGGATIQQESNLVYSLTIKNNIGVEVNEEDIEALFEASDEIDGEIEPEFDWVTDFDTIKNGVKAGVVYELSVVATDNAGNSDTCVLFVIVEDALAPVITNLNIEDIGGEEFDITINSDYEWYIKCAYTLSGLTVDAERIATSFVAEDETDEAEDIEWDYRWEGDAPTIIVWGVATYYLYITVTDTAGNEATYTMIFGTL